MSEYIKIPPIKKIGKALEKIIMAGKMLFDVFKNASKNGGKIESTSTDNAPETIEKVTEVFAEFKKQVHYKTEEIEKAIEGIGKSVSVRGEALTLEEFAALSNLLCESERMRTKE